MLQVEIKLGVVRETALTSSEVVEGAAVAPTSTVTDGKPPHFTQLKGWRPRSRPARLVVDAALVFVLPLFVLAVFGVNQWVNPYSPDTEFYVGLGNFANEVISRTPTTGYYWTRIGLIGPVHLLVSAFGFQVAYYIWHGVLLVLTVLPAYLIIKPRLGRVAGAAAVLIIATNTTVLVTLVDYYPSSAILAAFSLLAGFGCLAVAEKRAGKRAVAYSIVAGAASGWLMALHFGTLVVNVGASATIVALLIFQYRRASWRPIVSFIATAVVVFGLFLVWLRLLFPGRNWFVGNYEALTVTDWSIFHEKTLTWLVTDPGLLVIPLALAVGVIAWTRISAVRTHIRTLVFMLFVVTVLACVQQFLLGGQNLQLPYYYTQLWPFALLLMALSVLLLATKTWQRYALVAAAALLLPIAGMTTWTFDWIPIGIGVAAAAVAAFAIGFAITRGGQKAWPTQAVAIVLGVAVLCGVQVLQNGMGAVKGLIIARNTPQQAYADPEPWVEPYWKFALQVDSWVIANTPRSRVVNWSSGSPRELVGPGYVAVDATSMAPSDLKPSAFQQKQLVHYRPKVIAFTAPSVALSRGYIEAISPTVAQTDIYACRDFQEAYITGGTCLARLSYPSKSR